MRIYSKKTLDEFGKTHADVANVLQGWYRVAKSAKWQNIQDVKQSCSASADAAGRFTVFNIKGNKYRLIVSIDYERQIINIKYILTHAEYDSGRWKNDPYY
ncbi:MAG: type II toxin-antitoxin system HigB family toxin [Pseudanabaena sp.]|jgi:mRNA interferase HigB|nr:type II toxin-antitoxin system HigB family toxin [Pseudanabaena sp. M179S2SP2A07QC]MCA6530957.1 type II toxin-antitoxin system HigB family toxin [Pseudanabaena sp. M125S2SP2A07QC]MCA6535554.1 type II toxin-antitoxin system HigB family toxin [Pseudanabaena sp. M176S2SP2A07QC]MCA6540758.1 type II toxin-antitoxin system HigB family toxin [Pseudanabaena sp. M037S2SP2A07QC]MCA6544166.1 type II toxin-antitoxin system HigB family toxin [Pseudanabaena sp. M074S1SP2A07QC]MCA6546415.1 type II toxin-a